MSDAIPLNNTDKMDKNSEGSASLSKVYIALIIVSILVLLGAAGVITILLIRRCKLKDTQKTESGKPRALVHHNSNSHSTQNHSCITSNTDSYFPVDNGNKVRVDIEKPMSGEYSYTCTDLVSAAMNSESDKLDGQMNDYLPEGSQRSSDVKFASGKYSYSYVDVKPAPKKHQPSTEAGINRQMSNDTYACVTNNSESEGNVDLATGKLANGDEYIDMTSAANNRQPPTDAKVIGKIRDHPYLTNIANSRDSKDPVAVVKGTPGDYNHLYIDMTKGNKNRNPQQKLV